MNDPRLTPKVLYIENNSDTRALIRRVLSHDFIVLAASDPISGIELAIDTTSDIVLSEINLPQMSGREALAKCHPTTSLSRIIDVAQPYIRAVTVQ